MSPLRLFVRIGMTAADRVRKLGWRLSKRPIGGVRAIVLTPENQVVLVRHSYTRGWYLPSGGMKSGEDPQTTILRELREEIGLVEGSPTEMGKSGGMLGNRPETLTTFVVRNAIYRPRWSLEIEEVGAFALDALPSDLSPGSRRAITAFLEK